MSKRKWTILCGLIVVLGLAAFGYQQFKPNQYVAILEHAPVTTGHASWAFDPNDAVKLSDFSSHIFIGSVEEVKGSTLSPDGLVYTDSVVRVHHELKGQTNGKRVLISQFGGYRTDTKTIELIEGDLLIKKGETYIFYTTKSQEKHSFVIPAPTGKVKLDTAPELASLIDRVKIKNDTAPFDAENDYEVPSASLQAWMLSPAFKEAHAKLAQANQNPGIWKAAIFSK